MNQVFLRLSHESTKNYVTSITTSQVATHRLIRLNSKNHFNRFSSFFPLLQSHFDHKKSNFYFTAQIVFASSDTSAGSSIWTIFAAISIAWAWFGMCFDFSWWQSVLSIRSCSQFTTPKLTVSKINQFFFYSSRFKFVQREEKQLLCLLPVYPLELKEDINFQQIF